MSLCCNGRKNLFRKRASIFNFVHYRRSSCLYTGNWLSFFDEPRSQLYFNTGRFIANSKRDTLADSPIYINIYFKMNKVRKVRKIIVYLFTVWCESNLVNTAKNKSVSNWIENFLIAFIIEHFIYFIQFKNFVFSKLVFE